MNIFLALVIKRLSSLVFFLSFSGWPTFCIIINFRKYRAIIVDD